MLLLPHIIYSSQPKLAKEYALSFADDCIRFKTEDIDSTVQWSLYHAWLSDDQFYILYHGKRNLTVIPRRATRGRRRHTAEVTHSTYRSAKVVRGQDSVRMTKSPKCSPGSRPRA